MTNDFRIKDLSEIQVGDVGSLEFTLDEAPLIPNDYITGIDRAYTTSVSPTLLTLDSECFSKLKTTLCSDSTLKIKRGGIAYTASSAPELMNVDIILVDTKLSKQVIHKLFIKEMDRNISVDFNKYVLILDISQLNWIEENLSSLIHITKYGRPVFLFEDDKGNEFNIRIHLVKNAKNKLFISDKLTLECLLNEEYKGE